MKPDEYPPQEPFNELGRAYHDAVSAKAPAAAPLERQYGSDPYQSLALFAPADPRGDVLVFGHGGGWTNGYKEWMAFMAPALNARGVFCQRRLSPGARPPVSRRRGRLVRRARLGLPPHRGARR